MILLASMMRSYELMVVLRPDFGVEEKPIKTLIQKLVGERTLKDVTVMGKKRLAYIIKKQTEAVYAVATIIGEPIQVATLEKQLKMGTDVIRYLLITK